MIVVQESEWLREGMEVEAGARRGQGKYKHSAINDLSPWQKKQLTLAS